MKFRRILPALFLLISLVPAYTGWAPFQAGNSASLPLTNWTQLNLGGGGNVSGLAISAQGVKMVRGDVFNAWILGTDNRWHVLGSVQNMPCCFGLIPNTNTSANQVWSGFTGVMEIAPCPSSATCAYLYGGTGHIYYSNSISASNPSSITWCDTGVTPFTMSSLGANSVIGPADPGPFMAVDPNNTAHVYVGTPSQGLYETFNGTACATSGSSTFTQVSSATIPVGTKAFPAEMIAFDPTSATTTRSVNTVTSKVYVFTYGTTAGVYASTDGGATFALTTSGPTTMLHLKVSGDQTGCPSACSKGGGNVWAVDSTNLNSNCGYVWELIGSTWTKFTANGNTYCDVAINPNNGDHVLAWNGNATVSCTSGGACNGSAASASINWTTYTATHVAGDSPWNTWASIGWSPHAVEFDPSNNDHLLTNGGQWTMQFDFPSANFNVAALSAGINGSVTWMATNYAAQSVLVGAQDITGCQYTIANASTPASTCIVNATFNVNFGLMFSQGQSITNDGSAVCAKIGPDSGNAFDLSGCSTDVFTTIANFAPFNLWKAVVATGSSTITNNGSGAVRVTVPSTSLLNTWAPGDALTRNSIICAVGTLPFSLAGQLGQNATCDEIVVVDATHFDMPNFPFISSQQTTGYQLIFYVPAFAMDNSFFGANTITNITSSGGAIQVAGGANFAIGTNRAVCISGVTAMPNGTVANGCFTSSATNLTLRGSTFAAGDTYQGGGTVFGLGLAGGGIAAASTSNISQTNLNSFPLCTTNGGQTWAYERLSANADLKSAGTFTGTNSGNTISVASGTPSATTVLLTSGRFLATTGTTSAGVYTFSPVPTGDSIASGSNFYNTSGGTGYSSAVFNSVFDITHDTVTPNTFYAVNSNAGLLTWTNCNPPTVLSAESPNTGWLIDAGLRRLKAVPTEAGHLFFVPGPQTSAGINHPVQIGLWRTCQGTQSSATMQAVPGMYEPSAVGFGKAATGYNYPTIYVSGWYSYDNNYLDSVFGIWESVNDPNNGVTSAQCTNRSSTAMTGGISGTTLTVSAITGTPIILGDYVACATCAAGTQITALGTGTGGTGTYTVSPSQTVSAGTSMNDSPWTNIGTAATGSPLGVTLGTDGQITDITGDMFIHGPVYISGAYQTAYGVFPYLLKRDLDPAANDNSPAFLNKVG